ncbi:hypothetical protein AVEN_160487-1, partial [Araneus ventricosus]
CYESMTLAILPALFDELLSLVPKASSLAKPRVAGGSYLWTVIGGIRTVAPYLWRVDFFYCPRRSCLTKGCKP